MEDFLIGSALVITLIVFLLMLAGTALMLGQLFAGATQRLTRRMPTAADRKIARLLAEPDPTRR
ncbi:hypothetical protein ACFOLC_00275 [Lysobacter cavernae]|uniref:Uncharacterized protein n=1 Tax=Lysobacter cavernae TaxID=1685901 RepID=A0ABV7RJF9_9GAMM